MSTATAGQLALFRVPKVRQDCSFKLAVLYRETCLLDNGGGYFASNKYLAEKLLKCHPSSVRDYYSILREHGLVELWVEHGRERHARPLVHLQDLFILWPELASVCSKDRRLCSELKAEAREALKQIGGKL